MTFPRSSLCAWAVDFKWCRRTVEQNILGWRGLWRSHLLPLVRKNKSRSSFSSISGSFPTSRFWVSPWVWIFPKQCGPGYPELQNILSGSRFYSHKVRSYSTGMAVLAYREFSWNWENLKSPFAALCLQWGLFIQQCLWSYSEVISSQPWKSSQSWH